MDLLAWCGAKLRDGDGDCISAYMPAGDEDRQFWDQVVEDGGDEGTGASQEVRVSMLEDAGVDEPTALLRMEEKDTGPRKDPNVFGVGCVELVV